MDTLHKQDIVVRLSLASSEAEGFGDPRTIKLAKILNEAAHEIERLRLDGTDSDALVNLDG